MREQLLGYLLEALEADEREEVEDQLERDPSLRRELELLDRSLDPLRADDEYLEPPTGLAQRTLTAVLDQSQRAAEPVLALSPCETSASRSRWSLGDLAVAAGIFLAGAMLLFPAIQHSREMARLRACENNLRELGVALTQYSSRNGDYFPVLHPQGKMAAAGMYAVRLLHGGFLTDRSGVICPSSSLAEQPDCVYVPTTDELQRADGDLLIQLHEQMGGSYGYSLGYISDGRYYGVRNRGRATFAIMADAPSPDRQDHQSGNHAGCGQNVLFEDGHVRYMTRCFSRGLRDHIFLNDDGLVAAGLHENDAVIGHSAAQPLIQHVARPGR